MMPVDKVSGRIIAHNRNVTIKLAMMIGIVTVASSATANDLYSRISIGSVYSESPTQSEAAQGRVAQSEAGQSEPGQSGESKAGPGTVADTATVTETEVNADNPATPGGDLVGTWVSTAKRGEVIAVRFFTDGRFTLAVARSGAATSSSLGQFVRQRQSLILVGDDGHCIAATTVSLSANEMTLRFVSGGQVEFNRVR